MARLLRYSHIATVLPARPLTDTIPQCQAGLFSKTTRQDSWITTSAGDALRVPCWLHPPTRVLGPRCPRAPTARTRNRCTRCGSGPGRERFFLAKRVSSKSSGGHEFRSHQPPRNVLSARGQIFMDLYVYTTLYLRYSLQKFSPI